MPPAIIPIVGAVAGGIVSSAVGAAIGGGIIGTIIGSLAGGAVAIGVSYLGAGNNGKLSNPASSFSSSVQGGGRTQMVRQPITAHKIIYGETRVSGPMVYIHSRPIDGSSPKLDMLHLAIVLAAHEVEEIGAIYFTDAVVPLDGGGAATSEPYKKDGTVFATIYKHLGTTEQTADAVLVANSDGEWTSAHRLRGLAYIHAMLRWDEKAYAGGLPNISAIVKGRKVYDPRSETTEWSDNPALCIMDYLTADFGLQATLDEIDLDSFIAAANICDEFVDTIESSERRYTCNGVVDLSSTPQSILEDMLTSCAGHLICIGGKWRLRVGAWNPAVHALEPKHARDSVVFRPYRTRRELINVVKGAFISPDHQWQPTDYPEVAIAAYQTQDGGDYAASTLDLPFTQSPTMAQRIARIALEQNRRQKALSFPANLTGFRVAAGDNVSIDLPRFGLAGLVCTVSGWQMSEDLGVDLDLIEDDESVYSFSASDLKALDGAPSVTVLNNAAVQPAPPADVTAIEGADYIKISWRQITDSDFLYVEVWEDENEVADPEHDAARIMEVYGNTLTRNNLPGAATRYYWLRTVDRFGNRSDFTDPLEATTTGDESIVLILE